MAHYEASLKVSEALALYYKAAGIDPLKTYEEKMARIELGPFHFYIPNTETRKRELRLHDIHHVLTGYDTDWKGEGRISAWEIASGGCGPKALIWFIILSAAFVGLLIDPNETLKAFRLGKTCRNLFGQDAVPLHALTVGELRARVGLPGAAGPES